MTVPQGWSGSRCSLQTCLEGKCSVIKKVEHGTIPLEPPLCGDSPGPLAADNLGLHRVLGLLCLGQLHHPGPGRVGRGSAGLRGRHKHVPGGLDGHHLTGHHPHQCLLPTGRHLGHRLLQRRHGHPQPAAQALLLLPALPHVPGAWGRPPVPRFPWTFSGT
nr:type-1 angiotensin II receptor-associated protein isoform X1 [Marmota flaviventris]